MDDVKISSSGVSKFIKITYFYFCCKEISEHSVCCTVSFSRCFLRPNMSVFLSVRQWQASLAISSCIVSRLSLSCTALSTIPLFKQSICNWFSGFTLVCYECWRCFLGLLHHMSVDCVANLSEEPTASIFSVSVIGERKHQVYVSMRSIEPTGRSEEGYVHSKPMELWTDKFETRALSEPQVDLQPPPYFAHFLCNYIGMS
jgi:hypothetical protein